MYILLLSGPVGIVGFIQISQQMSKEEMEKVKHFLHVEWGGDSHAGRHAEATAPIRKEGESDGDAALKRFGLGVEKRRLVGKLYR